MPGLHSDTSDGRLYRGLLLMGLILLLNFLNHLSRKGLYFRLYLHHFLVPELHGLPHQHRHLFDHLLPQGCAVKLDQLTQLLLGKGVGV